MHLDLNAAATLAEHRRHACPCGASAEHPGGICRKCLARLAWRERHTSPHRARQHRRRRSGRLAWERARNPALTAAADKRSRKDLELS